MIRQTSLDTYYKIKEEGLLSKRRWEVYDYIYKNGPCTSKECNKFYAKQGANSSSYMSRFTELRDMGVIEEVGRAFDPESRQTLITWDITGRLPIKNEKPIRHKCKACNGKGFIEEKQFKLF